MRLKFPFFVRTIWKWFYSPSFITWFFNTIHHRFRLVFYFFTGINNLQITKYFKRKLNIKLDHSRFLMEKECGKQFFNFRYSMHVDAIFYWSINNSWKWFPFGEAHRSNKKSRKFRFLTNIIYRIDNRYSCLNMNSIPGKLNFPVSLLTMHVRKH